MISLGFSTLGSLAAVWVSERLGYRFSIISGALTSGVILAAIPFIPNVPILMVVQISLGLGNGVLMTTLMGLSIHDVPREHRATAMGIYQAVYAVGMLAGPLVSGFLGNGFGLDTVFFTAASFNIAVVILAFLPVFSKHIAVQSRRVP
jgi:MFS family permease